MNLYNKSYRIILFIILLLSNCSYALEQEQYVEKLLIEGKNGSGPGEVKWKEFGMLPSGPSSFAVNRKGEIFILDDINDRIAKFDKYGKFIANFPLDSTKGYVDIAFDKKCNLYLKHLYDSITVFDKNMKHRRDIDLKKRAGGTYKGIEVTNHNTILFVSLRSDSAFDWIVEIDTNGNDISVNYNREYYIETKGEYFFHRMKTKDGSKCSDSIYNTEGKALFSKKKDLNIVGGIIIGIDSLKNIYIKKTIHNFKRDRLLKVNPNGKILADFQIISSKGHADISRKERVSDAGYVYVLDGWYKDEKFQLWEYYPE
jgi:hypothetical protein